MANYVRPVARRRHWFCSVAVPVLVVLALAATACGSTSNSGDPGSPPAAGDADPKVSLDPACPVGAVDRLTVPVAITVWAPFTGAARAALDVVVSRYNATHPMVKVSVTQAPADPAAQRQAYRQASASAALPTIVAADSTLDQYLIDTGTVTSASACRKAAGIVGRGDALPALTNASSINGIDWAGSASPSTEVLFYRRDAFSQAGLNPDAPPRNLVELEQQARKLKGAGATSPPLVLPLDAFLVENWITGAGATIVNHANGHEKRAQKALLDNPATLRLYVWIQRMMTEGLLSMVAPSDGQPNETPDATLAHAAMTVGPSSAIGAIATATITTMPDLDAAPLPGLDGAGRGQVSGISWFPTNTGPDSTRAAAWDFLTFLNTIPNQVVMNVTGSYLPNNTKAADDPTLVKVWTVTRRGPWLDTAYTQLTNLDPAGPGPLIGPYEEIRAAIRASLAAVVGGRPPKDAIAEADQAIDAALAAYRPGP
jgi:sn-glycerol 3-phosphate transport system substrate-binding protein